MKFKKAFAWILAVAMVITLMPSMAFASTSNASITVPTVSSDSTIGNNAIISMKNTSGVPITNGTIKLTLENASFSNGAVSLGDTNEDINKYIHITTNSAVTTTGWDNKIAGFEGDSTIDVTADSTGNTSVTLTFDASGTPAGAIPDGQYMYLVLNGNFVYAGSDDGPVNLIIDGRDSRVSSGTYAIANVGSGRTVAEVTGKIDTLSRVSIESASKIEITETSINSIANDVTKEVIRLTLPKDCTWNGVKVDGGMAKTPFDLSSTSGSVPSEFTSSTAQGLYVDNANTRIAYLVVDIKLDSGKRDTLTITPKYTIGKDTPTGDITVDIVGYRAFTASGASNKTISDASGLIIAKYGEESVEVSTVAEENLPTIISGKEVNDKDRNFTVKISLQENMMKALQPGRYVDFDFPEEIQIKKEAGVKYVISDNKSAGMKGTLPEAHIDLESSKSKDASGFSFLVPDKNLSNDTLAHNNEWKSTKANTITFEIPVTVEAGYEGDITCTVKGAKAGVEETSVVVGKALPPITITANTTEIRTGVQSQAVADITITENVAGYLSDVRNANTLQVGIDSLGLVSGMSIAKFDKVEVTSGNLEIGKASITSSGSAISDVGGDFIKIPIQSNSSTASTIVISGVHVNLNRTLPEGGYTLLAGGLAAVDNTAYNEGDFSDVAAKLADYVKIVTPADSVQGGLINATFVLRQDTFTNNGETVKMDTAPYLDANNRTQMPIRYAAMACGVDEKDISWDQASQTATINGKNVVLRITIGSNIMQTSNGPITMDTAAVSSNGRIFVPIRYIANALGAEVGWNYDTKTITLTN